MDTKRPRRWDGYAVLERDESLYRIGLGDPAKVENLAQLEAMGWRVVSVEIIERI